MSYESRVMSRGEEFKSVSVPDKAYEFSKYDTTNPFMLGFDAAIADDCGIVERYIPHAPTKIMQDHGLADIGLYSCNDEGPEDLKVQTCWESYYDANLRLGNVAGNVEKYVDGYIAAERALRTLAATAIGDEI